MCRPGGEWEGGRPYNSIVVVFMACVCVQETCYQYWPSSGTLTVGEFKVDLLGEELMDNSVLKTLSVTHTEVRDPIKPPSEKFESFAHFSLCHKDLLV